MLFMCSPDSFLESVGKSSKLFRFGIGNSPIFFCDRFIIKANRETGEIEGIWA